MKKIIVIGILLFLLFSTLPIGLGYKIDKEPIVSFGSGITLYVGGTGPNNYTSIQSAIDDASDGDTVYVYDDSSPYIEKITIDKSIYLIGEDRNTTNIHFDDDIIVSIFSDFVLFKDFTITGNHRTELRCNKTNVTENNFFSKWGVTIYGNNNFVSNNGLRFSIEKYAEFKSSSCRIGGTVSKNNSFSILFFK